MNNQSDIPVAYPPPPQASRPMDVMPLPPPPVGYPMRDGCDQQGHRPPTETISRGDGFWKGCVAAICCCWVLDFCCG